MNPSLDNRQIVWIEDQETADLNNPRDQRDLTAIRRMFHLTTTGHTPFSSAHGTFSRADHMLGHKTRLRKIEKSEIIPSTFTDHSGMKLEINSKRKTRQFMNTWKLNSTVLNNQWIKGEIKWGI